MTAARINDNIIKLKFARLAENNTRYRLKQNWGKTMACALRGGSSKLSKTKLWEPLPESILDEIT